MPIRNSLIIAILLTLILLVKNDSVHSHEIKEAKQSSQHQKWTKGKLIESRPTKVEIGRIKEHISRLTKLTESADDDTFEGCWEFCAEVCSIQPGGVCYCGQQSYSCDNAPPTTYPGTEEIQTPSGK